jgi:hypothetical protein
MSSVVISGDSSGAITLAAPSVAGTNTITLPAATGTAMVSGNMPAFGYYASSGTSISAGTYTKILFQTQEFDTASAVSSSRFTPTVAGYYQINAAVGLAGSTAASYGTANIYKNGSLFKQGTNYASTASSPAAVINSIVYLNGSTDYVEIYAITPGSITTNSGQVNSWWNGALIRAA